MMHVSRQKGKHSMVHAEPGKLKLSLGAELGMADVKSILDLVTEISADLDKRHWTGKFTFNKGTIDIELNSEGESRNWKRTLPIDSHGV